MSDIETKISAAKTKLILDKPFLGALVLRLPMVEADERWCPTSATDAKSIFYNHDYFDALNISQIQFVLSHEALHCALLHFTRRHHRIKSRWDLACDFAINPFLLKDGLTPPPGVMVLDEYEGMTAEEIYPFIEDNTEEQIMDRHLYDDIDDDGKNESGTHSLPQNAQQQQTSPSNQNPDNNQPQTNSAQPANSHHKELPPPSLSELEKQQLATQWKQRLAGAAQQASQAGKMGDVFARLVDHLIQPTLSWRLLLTKYMMTYGREDYSYFRPSRREGNAIIPGLRSAQIEIIVALDTSGSINSSEIKQFLSEINAIKGQVRAKVTLHACDHILDINGPWQYEPWENADYPAHFNGGGGTSFIPIFNWIEHKNIHPDLCIYFTDAKGKFPKHPPNYPVMWLVKGKAKTPWGQRIQLN